MKAENKQLIKELLQAQLDSNLATFYYLDHQYALPQKHRIEQDSEEVMGVAMKTLKSANYKLQKAMEDLETVPTDVIIS